MTWDQLSYGHRGIMLELADLGPLRATRTDAALLPAAADDADQSPWLPLRHVRSLIVLGLVRYVRDTDRYALTSKGYRTLPPKP